MPKFVSVDGVWKPVTKSTRRLLEGMGLKTIGQDVKNDPNLAVETPVEGEDRIASEGSEADKKKLSKVKAKRGVKSRKIKTKSV